MFTSMEVVNRLPQSKSLTNLSVPLTFLEMQSRVLNLPFKSLEHHASTKFCASVAGGTQSGISSSSTTVSLPNLVLAISISSDSHSLSLLTLF